ncbi:MAG: hypothetical protein NTZ98_08755 [Acidobacteria bacterium]|nr:hypothetical protein [Acidobacteriota bacterium]
MLRGLKAPSNERGDAATVAGRMAARKALAALLAQPASENRAALLEYVEERSASLRLHAQRQGAVTSFAPVAARGGNASRRGDASAGPTTSAVRREEFSCHYAGQLFGILGQSDVLDGGSGTARGRSVSKLAEIGITAIGACGVGNSVPTCNPDFLTATSSSSSSAMIMGVSTTYLAGLGCAVSGTLATERAAPLAAARAGPRPQFYDPCAPGGGGGGGGTVSDCVSVADQSTSIREEECGNRGWQLIAQATGRDGKTYTGGFGPGYAYGMWVQAYTDCSGTHHDTFPLIGEKAFQPDGIVAGQATFHWIMISKSDHYEACNPPQEGRCEDVVTVSQAPTPRSSLSCP